MRPTMSVVIATRDRKDEITACLRGVRVAALAARVPVEVIVVDDGSADGTPGRLRDLAHRWGRLVPLRPVFLPESRGPAGARNAGAAAARAPWVVFTDSDCRPSAGWLAAYAKAMMERPDSVMLEGPVVPQGGGPAEVYSHVVSNQRGGQGLTSNMAVRTDAFRKLGGLDERFNNPHCREDTDFYFTVLEGWGTPPFVPGAVVHHPVKPGRPGKFIRESRLCVHEPLLFFRHPRLYLTRLKWIDGWAIPAYHLGFHAAAVWAVLALLRVVPAGRGSWAGVAGLASLSLAATLYALVRHRRISPLRFFALAGESLIVPWLRLWWTGIGLVRAVFIIVRGRLHGAAARRPG